MKKTRCLWISLMLILFMMTGCAKQSGEVTGSSSVKILVVISSTGDTFRDSLTASIVESAAEKGVELEVQYADDDTAVQLKQMESAESAGFDVIICRPVNAEMALQLERAAGKLPVIFVNNCPSADRLEPDRYMYVGSDENVAGTYEAEYALSKLGSKQEINVAIIKGEPGHSATKQRTDAVKNYFKDAGKKANYVFIDHCDWSTDLAKQYFNIFLKTGKTVDCVISNNDSMAIGVVEAYKENGLNPADYIICGVDATTDGCQSIQNGEMAFSVCQSAKNQGRAAVDVAILLGSGQSAKDYQYTAEDGMNVWVDYEKVDSSNVSQYMK